MSRSKDYFFDFGKEEKGEAEQKCFFCSAPIESTVFKAYGFPTCPRCFLAIVSSRQTLNERDERMEDLVRSAEEEAKKPFYKLYYAFESKNQLLAFYHIWRTLEGNSKEVTENEGNNIKRI